jgi:hypothetical protein
MAQTPVPQNFLQLPRFSGVLAPINNLASALERALSGVLRTDQEARVPSIVLRSPSGYAFRLTVADDGQIDTTQVQG